MIASLYLEKYLARQHERPPHQIPAGLAPLLTLDTSFLFVLH